MKKQYFMALIAAVCIGSTHVQANMFSTFKEAANNFSARLEQAKTEWQKGNIDTEFASNSAKTAGGIFGSWVALRYASKHRHPKLMKPMYSSNQVHHLIGKMNRKAGIRGAVAYPLMVGFIMTGRNGFEGLTSSPRSFNVTNIKQAADKAYDAGIKVYNKGKDLVKEIMNNDGKNDVD